MVSALAARRIAVVGVACRSRARRSIGAGFTDAASAWMAACTSAADVTRRFRSRRLIALRGVPASRRCRAATAARAGSPSTARPRHAAASPAPGRGGRAAPARRRACRWSPASSRGAAAGRACRPCRWRCRSGWRRPPAPPAAPPPGSTRRPGGGVPSGSSCSRCRSLQPRTLARASRSANAALCQLGSGGSIFSSSPFAIVPRVPKTQLPRVSSMSFCPTCVISAALPAAPVATTGAPATTPAMATAVSPQPTAPSSASSAPLSAISTLRAGSNRSVDGSGACPTKS